MRSKYGAGRPSLVQTLDKDVYQVVRKLCDDHDLQSDGEPLRLSVPLVYEKIKRSNSSLNRKSKKLLEGSIERVINVIKEDRQDDSEDLGSIDDEFDGIQLSPIHAAESMNKSLVGMWTKSSTQEARDKDPSVVRETKVEQIKVKKRSSDAEAPPTKRKKTDRSPSTGVRLADLGGVDNIIEELRVSIVRPILFPSLYSDAGISPPRGVLLHGPPGCGKTMIANALAAEIGVPFISLSAPSIVSGTSGESEKALREHFEEAKKIAPCLIFLDEIDAICPKRETVQREMEKRIVSQLLTCMDDLAPEKTGGKPVIVIAASNRPDSLDPALRRAGRFDIEINMTIPTEQARENILRVLTKKLALSDGLDFKALARMTPGFVGADFNDLIRKAGNTAISRFFDSRGAEAPQMELDEDPSVSAAASRLRQDVKVSKDFLASGHTLKIENEDFICSLPRVQPMAKREGFATIPETTWDDVGALEAVRNELKMTITEPIRNPERYARFGLNAPTAALLWGPPGCGKTLLAKAVANEAKANFISVKGPELLNKYVGESEHAVRQVFERARATIPCVIFFDELDALAPKRDSTQSESSARVVNTLLMELSGLSQRQGIYVLGATNRPDTIDEALLRSGRLETLLFVGLPSEEDRVAILKTVTRKSGLVWDEAIANVARECEGFSGADLENLARKAGYHAILRNGESLDVCDFVDARKSVQATVEDTRKYERLEMRWGRMRGAVVPHSGNDVTHAAPNV